MAMTCVRIPLSCLLIMLAGTAMAQPPHYGELEVLARTHPTTPENLSPGDSIAGASPTLNDSGILAIRVFVASSGFAYGLWYGGNGAGQVVFNYPDTDHFMSDPHLNGPGLAVFERTESGSDNGLWVYDPDSGTTQRVTSQPFGTAGWSSPRMDDLGRIGFRSSFSGQSAFHSVAPPNDVALHAAQSGPLDPDGPWGFLFTPAFGPDRTISAKVALGEPTGPAQIRTFADDGSSILIAETTLTDPGSLFASFDNGVGVNAVGDVAFIAGLAGGGRGVFRSDGGVPVEIARVNAAGPVTEIEFFRPDLNDAGLVVFRGRDANSDRAVWVGDGNGLVRVAVRGSLVATTIGAGQINRPDSDIVFGGNPVINNLGDVAFIADLASASNINLGLGRALILVRADPSGIFADGFEP